MDSTGLTRCVECNNIDIKDLQRHLMDSHNFPDDGD